MSARCSAVAAIQHRQKYSLDAHPSGLQTIKSPADMIKRKLELTILGSCAVVGVVWALTTDYFQHLEFELNWLINVSSLLTVASFSVRGMLPLRRTAV